MKKMLLILLGFLLFANISSVQAAAVTWDFSTINIEMLDPTTGNWVNSWTWDDRVTFINDGNTWTEIIQDIGSNGLGDGDQFTEFGMLLETALDGTSLNFRKAGGGPFDDFYGYIYFNDLAGEIKNYVDNDGEGPTTASNLDTHLPDDTYDLEFYANSGAIEFWFDTDKDTTNNIDGVNSYKVADLNLLEGFGGSPTAEINGFESDFDFRAAFDKVYYPDFWSLAGGVSFDDFMTTYGYPAIFMDAQNLDATLKDGPEAIFNGPGTDDDQFRIGVLNEGSAEVSVVPEPGTMILFGLGLLGFAGIGRRKVQI